MEQFGCYSDLLDPSKIEDMPRLDSRTGGQVLIFDLDTVSMILDGLTFHRCSRGVIWGGWGAVVPQGKRKKRKEEKEKKKEKKEKGKKEKKERKKEGNYE